MHVILDIVDIKFGRSYGKSLETTCNQVFQVSYLNFSPLNRALRQNFSLRHDRSCLD